MPSSRCGVCFLPQIGGIGGEKLDVAILKNPLRCDLQQLERARAQHGAHIEGYARKPGSQLDGNVRRSRAARNSTGPTPYAMRNRRAK